MSVTRSEASYSDVAGTLEARWRQYWLEHDTYAVPNPGQPGFDANRPKLVVLDMFPYPSGAGLHIGHPRGYVATDIYVRFQRMRGRNVLHAMGFDSFGLPAEQYAIATGQHPRVTTDQNVRNISAQLQLLGLGHDPTRQFSTSDPSYYRWTQWIFLQLFAAFYDPEEKWVDPGGRTVVGRARQIETLEQRLRDGQWLLSSDGRAVPSSAGGRRASETEIPDAVDKARLAYLEEIPVNWCPGLGTVLSNEEVTSEGRSERGDHPVYKRSLRQWMLRITSYADRLSSDLGLVDWPSGVVRMQHDWIGRSTGADVVFSARTRTGRTVEIPVYTTRPDTLLGVTYLALTPSHPLVGEVTEAPLRARVEQYVREAQAGSTAAARAAAVEKTGVFSGATATHPLTGQPIPIWIADYVLEGYGSGAVMGVPAHDARDFEFARRYGLGVLPVVAPPDEWLEQANAKLADYLTDPLRFGAFTGEGVAVNSSVGDCTLDGLPTPQAKQRCIEFLEARGLGRPRVSYRLRDWLFSRQRYWGEPFPIVFDVESGRAHAVDASQLPIELPELTDFTPSLNQLPESPPDLPLGRVKGWVGVLGFLVDDKFHLAPGARLGDELDWAGARRKVRAFRREINTMPNWAGSCWYYLRYFDPKNEQAFVGAEVERYWSGVGAGQPAAGSIDLYVGGAEHAVLHLLYARFWHKVLFDLALVSTPEPFFKLVNQGMITADAYRDERGVYVDIHDVDVLDENGVKRALHRDTGEVLVIDPGKMGKRYKNGIPPEEVSAEYSVDTLRLYQMYLGPLEASLPWQPEAIIGLHRFLSSVWRFVNDAQLTDEVDAKVERLVNRTVRQVTGDIERLRFNTAIAHLIELNRDLRRAPAIHHGHLRSFVLLLAPFAPHLAEELLSRIAPEEHQKLKSAIHFPWPPSTAEDITEDLFSVAVQVNGKKRGELLDVPANISAQELEQRARQVQRVAELLAQGQVQKVISVLKPQPSLINFVVRP